MKEGPRPLYDSGPATFAKSVSQTPVNLPKQDIPCLAELLQLL